MATDVMADLDHIPLLGSLKKEQRKSLARKLKEVSFKAGENLMVQGERGDTFYLLVQGTAKVFMMDHGQQVEIATLEPGDYCGEQALLNACTRGATVQAAEAVSAYMLDSKTFQDCLGGVHFAKRERQRGAVTAEKLDDYKYDKSVDTTKDADTAAWLLDCVKDNILFHDFSTGQKRVVVQQMYPKKVAKGEALIKQGARGETFYVVADGEFDVVVKEIGKVEKLKKGKCVGELALLYNAPRAASVLCTSDATVWCVKRASFRKALADYHRESTKRNLGFLEKVELLQSLTNRERRMVDAALEKSRHPKGETIIKQGDVGDRFYIMRQGKCSVVKDGKPVKELGPGDYFGELALLNDDKRAASVLAASDVKCLSLDREHFTQLLGPLKELMERGGAAGPGPKALAKVVKTKPCQIGEFKDIGILGKGAFGLVKLVSFGGKSYALKAIKKNQIVEQGQQAHILTEKRVMDVMDSPFLVNLICTYKDKYKVYFLLDVCLGGELFTILRNKRSFDENTSRFYAACVIEGFAYMHDRDIIYRDLKPENLVLDSKGYCKITDFGFAKVVPDKTFTLCGTPDYLAPEIVTGQGHGKGVDWWTLGVLIYEMVASLPPFYSDDPMMTYRKIVRGKIKFPRCMSREVKDLISKLLKTKSTKRYGVIKGGADTIRSHPWFKKFDWSSLHNLGMKPPFVPKVRNENDISNFDKYPDEKEDLSFKGDPDLGWDAEF